jgi:hypothetical protein
VRFNKYSKEQFIEAVASSRSIAETLTKLGVVPAGGNYRVAKGYIAKLGLDTSHMTGQGWLKGQRPGPRRPIEVYLTNQQTIKSVDLKARLFSARLKSESCESCRLSKWLDRPMPLELHHVDGNHLNNNLSNLQILCPNCHAMTDTYRGKNKK